MAIEITTAWCKFRNYLVLRFGLWLLLCGLERRGCTSNIVIVIIVIVTIVILIFILSRIIWVWDGCKYALLTIWGKGGSMRRWVKGVQLGGNGGLIGKCIQNGLRGWYTALPPQSSNPWGKALQEQSLFLPFSRNFPPIFLQPSCNIGVEFKRTVLLEQISTFR